MHGTPCHKPIRVYLLNAYFFRYSKVSISTGEKCESAGSGRGQTEGITKQRRIRATYGQCHLDSHPGSTYDPSGYTHFKETFPKHMPRAVEQGQ